MASKQGDFVWHDLMTTDVKAAAEFYSRVVGWTAADSGMPGMDYMLFSAGPTLVAGLMALPDEARAADPTPRWTGHVGVADVDAKAAEVTREGGAVLRAPEDIPGIGRFAVVADPHGAVFELFHGRGEHPEPPPLGTPGTIGWNELHAGNGEADFVFYSGLFGWTKDQAIPMGPMGTYQLFANGGPAIGGMMTKMAQTPRPHWLFYVNVEAIDASVARATEAGGTLVHGPSEVPGGQWVAHCRDPQGGMFAMVAPGR